ncbi:MAG: hypothetical protein HKN28_08380 [Alphaproteobacteria bacterium]|nr:hypothetical protein [Alphaproteobacteria bacterium]
MQTRKFCRNLEALDAKPHGIEQIAGKFRVRGGITRWIVRRLTYEGLQKGDLLVDPRLDACVHTGSQTAVGAGDAQAR